MSQKGDQIIEDIQGTPYRIMNWHGYKVVFGGDKGPFFFNDVEQRRNENRQNMILIAGSPGEGKSYTGLRLGEIFDPAFNVNEQVVFDRLQLLTLIGEKTPLKRGQVIMIDEAQFVAGSRNWYEEIQKDLMDHMEAVRSKGFIIIIVALHLDLLDKIIRKYVLTFMIHMEKRGLGTIYHLYTPRFETEMYRRRLGKIQLTLPDNDKCNYLDCLECKHRYNCMTDRAIYERRKKTFLDTRNREAMAKEFARKKPKKSEEDIAKLWIEHKDELRLTDKGRVDLDVGRIIVKKYWDIDVSRHKADLSRAYYEMLSKELERIHKNISS